MINLRSCQEKQPAFKCFANEKTVDAEIKKTKRAVLKDPAKTFQITMLFWYLPLSWPIPAYPDLVWILTYLHADPVHLHNGDNIRLQHQD